jgi:hypothetical protein
MKAAVLYARGEAPRYGAAGRYSSPDGSPM